MITFYFEDKKVHESNVTASLAPEVGTFVKFHDVSIPHGFDSFKVRKVVYVYNGGVDAEVFVDLPNVV
jgi:hypothetical protein